MRQRGRTTNTLVRERERERHVLKARVRTNNASNEYALHWWDIPNTSVSELIAPTFPRLYTLSLVVCAICLYIWQRKRDEGKINFAKQTHPHSINQNRTYDQRQRVEARESWSDQL